MSLTQFKHGLVKFWELGSMNNFVLQFCNSKDFKPIEIKENGDYNINLYLKNIEKLEKSMFYLIHKDVDESMNKL
jgi:hypothetical protein